MATNFQKFYGVGVIKGSFLFSLFGFVLGIIAGFLFFIFIESAIKSWGITHIPIFGLFFISFLVIPLTFFIVSLILGSIFFLLLNLFLKLTNGVNLYFKEETFGKVSSSKSIEEPYKLPEYQPNN
jgi:hypothetical protein